MASEELNAVMLQRIEVAPGLAIMRVVPSGWELPEFIPGQYAVLALPGSAPRSAGSEEEDPKPKDPSRLIKRAYSIASSSVLGEYLEFYIVRVPSGQLTPRLFALNHGDPLWLAEKIRGMFTLQDVPPDKHLVFVATGTGLAPYMSMLRSEFAPGSSRRFAVLHGARHSWDLGYRSELMTLQRMAPNFTYVPVISQPEDERIPWKGQVGFLNNLWEDGLIERAWGFKPTPEDTHIFLCGNPLMIEAMITTLGKDGFNEHTKREAGQIHLERYW